jgi:cell division control protein 6
MGRDEQTAKLTSCLSPALKGQKPVHAWLYGAPGTGKTAVARSVISQAQNGAQIQSSYINCWQNSTFYSVVEKIIYDLRSLKAERVSSSFKLETLQKKLAGRPYIVVLDEIDQPQPKERDAILYNLCNIGNIGLVCICNSRRTLFGIEERIKSRLNPVQIEFPPYSSDQMIQILQGRASQALVSNTWDVNIVERIASMSGGDARVAIHTLRNAARHADDERSGRLQEEHVVKGHNNARNLRKTYLLDRMDGDYRILFQIVARMGEVESGALWHAYLIRCVELNRKPIAVRTFSEYMNRLFDMELIQIDRAPIKGNVRLFRVRQ